MSPAFTPEELLKRFAGEGLPEAARRLLPTRTAPGRAETAVVALECPRTAALCFDRVWSIPVDHIECPEEIAFSSTSDAEAVAALWMHLIDRERSTLSRVLEDEQIGRALAVALVDGNSEMLLARKDLTALYALLLLSSTLAGSIEGAREFPLKAVSRTLSGQLQQALGRRVVPVYESEASRDAEYGAGEHEVIVASLRQLEVVDEQALDWEHVLEFRRDNAARSDYRRLVHWLDGSMVGRSTEFVVNEIGVRLDSYRKAVRKHGLETRLGVLASVLDKEALVPASAAIGSSLLAGEPVWGALAAGGVLVGKVAIAIGQARVDLEEIRREHADVAFVAQINERLTRTE